MTSCPPSSGATPTQYMRVTRLSPAFHVRVWLRETTGKCSVKKSTENRLFYVVVEGNQAIVYDRIESMSVAVLWTTEVTYNAASM